MNLALLRDPRSGVDAAFVQGGVDAVVAGERSMVASLGSVADEPVWLFYREANARERLRPIMKRIRLQGNGGGARSERLWRDSRILAIVGGASEGMLDEAAKRY